MSDTLQTLWVWLPYLLGGFLWNIWIAALAMGLGTLLGGGLALLRLSERRRTRRVALVLTELTRNVPTIVFQFYLAFMLPTEFKLPGLGWSLGVPLWLNAALALAMAVIGFCSDNLEPVLRDWRDGRRIGLALFVPNWASYLLIIVIASSTASIIGVSELVSRANTVISASGRTELMGPVYGLACAIFFFFCWPLMELMRRLRQHLAQRLAL